MTAGPQASIVFVPISVGASVDFARPQKPAPYRRHKVPRWGRVSEPPVDRR
jgi:hypothetical protein